MRGVYKRTKPAWNKGTKGIMKPNSGTWKKGGSGGLRTRFGTNGHKGKTRRGQESNFWNGGDLHWSYGSGWTVTFRRSIRERDKYTCRLCNSLQGDAAFDIHHIDYNKTNHNPANLITLCRSCHMKTNTGRSQWTKYFSSKIGV